MDVPPQGDIEDGPIVYLAGGLGNQIFMLASGFWLAKKHGTELFVDTSFYSAKKFRAPEILQSHRVSNVGPDSPWQSLRLAQGRVIPWPRSVLALRRPPLFDLRARLTEVALKKAGPNRTLIGYFQSFRFFEGAESDIASWLNATTSTYSQPSTLRNLEIRPFVCIHIRRGDLVSGTRLSPQAATINYFSRAIAMLPERARALPLVVFTDSRDIVEREIQNHEVLRALDLEYFDDSGMTSNEVLLAMSKADHFVLSSSTFGFWACWLAHFSRSRNICVISPKNSLSFWNRVDSGIQPMFI